MTLEWYLMGRDLERCTALKSLQSTIFILLRMSAFVKILKFIDLFPFCFSIVRKWNKSDHADRVKDGSVTYDKFALGKEKIEYSISKCMYVEMFAYYGIRPLCKIFCNTDRIAYSGLTRHVKFVRHSDLSDGCACFDEIFRK